MKHPRWFHFEGVAVSKVKAFRDPRGGLIFVKSSQWVDSKIKPSLGIVTPFLIGFESESFLKGWFQEVKPSKNETLLGCGFWTHIWEEGFQDIQTYYFCLILSQHPSICYTEEYLDAEKKKVSTNKTRVGRL